MTRNQPNKFRDLFYLCQGMMSSISTVVHKYTFNQQLQHYVLTTVEQVGSQPAVTQTFIFKLLKAIVIIETR